MYVELETARCVSSEASEIVSSHQSILVYWQLVVEVLLVSCVFEIAGVGKQHVHVHVTRSRANDASRIK